MSQDSTDTKAEAAKPPELETGATLASRFRVEGPLPGRAGHTIFQGREVGSNTEVVLIPVSAQQAAAVGLAKNVEHPHVGHLLEVVELDAEHSVLVVARVPGQTLAERLAKVGKKTAVDAVRSALRVTDALNALHDANAVHGFVHAASVVVEPEHREPPVLIYYPPGDGEPLHAPERAIEAAPTVADDTWAAAGLLFWMLTGAPPEKSGYTTEDALLAAGVADPVLRAALFPTLAADFSQRQTNLKPLRRELARWFVEHAGEEPVTSSGSQSYRPPPLPPSKRPASARPPVASARPVPAALKRRLALFAGVAIVLGVMSGVGLAFFRPKKIKIIPVAPPEPEKSASPLEIGEVPVTAPNEQRLGGGKLAACVAGYLPKGTFGKAPDVEWLCSETDPRAGGEKLRVAIVSAAPKGEVTDAMKIFARIGWYEMPAFAMVRAGCCPDAKPLALPDAHCSMDAALRELGDAVVSVKDVDASLKKYTESIHCELNHGGAKMLRRSTRPAGGEDTAFRELVKNLE